MTAIPPPEPPHWARDAAVAVTILATYVLGLVVGALWWAPPVVGK